MRLPILLLVCIASANAQSWYNSSWLYRKAIVIDHRQLAADLTNFPFRVDTNAYPELITHALANRNDVLFTAADGTTKRSHCLASNGIAAANLPTVSSSVDTVVWMYYGNSGASDQRACTSVWDGAYGPVYDWSGGSLLDLTSAAKNAVKQGNPAAVPGYANGSALAFNGSTDFLTFPCSPTTAYTYDFWIKPETVPSDRNGIDGPLFGGSNAGFGFIWDHNEGSFTSAAFQNAGGYIPAHIKSFPGQLWAYIAAVWNGSTLDLYMNGGKYTSIPAASLPATSNGCGIATVPGATAPPYWRGTMSDFRFTTNLARPREYIAATYANRVLPNTFYLTGGEQQNTAAAPVIDSFTTSYAIVESGKPAYLRWLVRGATAVTISNGPGAQTALTSGGVAVSPTVTTTYTLTASGATSPAATAQVIVTVPTDNSWSYIHTGAPAGVQICNNSPGFRNGSVPAEICTIDPHGLLPGDTVTQYGIAIAEGSGAARVSNLNGTFRVKQKIDETHYTITSPSGVDMTPNGTWAYGCEFSANCGGAPAWTNRVQLLPVNSGLAGSQIDLQKLALSTDNGLTSLICFGTCTVTTNFPHGLVAGNRVSIWNTTNSTLSPFGTGGEYILTGATSTTFSFNGGVTGDFTRNNICGPSTADPHTIGATVNCVTVSLYAISTNLGWVGVLQQSDATTVLDVAHKFDGGNQNYTTDSFTKNQSLWYLRSLVDRRSQLAVDILVYQMTHLYRIGGVGFAGGPVEIKPGYSGQYNIVFEAGNITNVLAEMYRGAEQYLTTPERQAASEMVQANIYDPNNQCTPAYAHRLPDTGTVTVGGDTTITINGRAIAAKFINGVGTTFTSLTVGEGIFVTNKGTGDSNVNWLDDGQALGNMGDDESMIARIDSDTLMVIIEANTAEGRINSIAQRPWIVPKWASGQCGIEYLISTGYAWGGQNVWFPNADGAVTALLGPNGKSYWYQNQEVHNPGRVVTASAFMSADPVRSRYLMNMGASVLTNWTGRFNLMHQTGGYQASGCWYGNGTTLHSWSQMLSVWRAAFPTLTTVGQFAHYADNWTMMRMYTYPDAAYGVYEWPMHEANSGPGCRLDYGTGYVDWTANVGLLLYPNSDISRRFVSFSQDPVIATGVVAHANLKWMAGGFAYFSELLQPLDYKLQPRQWFFDNTPTQQACEDFSGWNGQTNCNFSVRRGVYSRSDWTSRNGAILQVSAGGWWEVGGYNYADVPEIKLYKTGWLKCPGLHENCDSPWGGPGAANLEAPVFGNTSLRIGQLTGEPLSGSMPRWAAGDHGTWDSHYGDQTSRYMYARVDHTSYYTRTPKHAYRDVMEFKKAGAKHVVVQYDDIEVDTPTAITVQLFFPQNGGTLQDSLFVYVEGNTVCDTGGPGCTDTSTSNTPFIREHESGAVADAFGPARTAGMLTKVFSPVSVGFAYEGSGYAGNAGTANRASIYGGGAQGIQTTGLQAVVVMKIVDNFATEDTLSATAINPNANWTGYEGEGTVGMFARNGVLQSTLAFTTTHTGTAQYLAAGFTPGVYTVTRNGVSVPGAQTTVYDADNSLYFESASGAIVIARANGSLGIACNPLAGPSQVNLAYSATCTATGGTGPYAWAVSSGSLPTGISLSPSTGGSTTISGTPTVQGAYAYTVTVTDSAAASISTAYSGTILPPPPGCPVFPADNIWNFPVTSLSPQGNSAAIISAIGPTSHIRIPDAMPVNVVPSNQALVPLLGLGVESDPGPAPIPPGAVVEANSDGHVLVVQQQTCQLWELYKATKNVDNSWNAENASMWILTSNALRTLGWTSADAAGLPILPGLINYDELINGTINHAMRVTVPQSTSDYVWPARHSAANGGTVVVMGQRLRLKSSFDVTPYPVHMQHLLNALKTYGMMVADNGLPWSMQRVDDARFAGIASEWDTLTNILGSNFEAVDASTLAVNEATSGQANVPMPPAPNPVVFGGKGKAGGKSKIH